MKQQLQQQQHQQHPQQQQQFQQAPSSAPTSNINNDINNSTNSSSAPSPILLATASQHSTGSARERKRLVDSNILLNGSSHHSRINSGNNSNKNIDLSNHTQAISEASDHHKRILSDGDLASIRKHRSSSPDPFYSSVCCCWDKMGSWNSTKVLVLIILSLQNSLFTVLRRYSQGVLHEDYSKYEVLLVGEIIKMIFSAYMIRKQLLEHTTGSNNVEDSSSPISNTGFVTQPDVMARLHYLMQKSGKMVGLALIYGAMNILSFVSLRNIGAGMFTIFAQCKILTTASFSTLLLQRRYSWVKWRALVALIFGVLLFSEPIWGHSENLRSNRADANLLIGVAAVLIEVILSGFASIYFEKVVKTDPLQLTIWERNFQLAFVRCWLACCRRMHLFLAFFADSHCYDFSQ